MLLANTNLLAKKTKKAVSSTTKEVKAHTTIDSKYINASLEKAAKRAGIPESLLRAVCHTESGLTPSAFRKNDGPGLNNHAFGLCQVIRTTAEKIARRKDDNCLEDFSKVPSRKRIYSNCRWFGPLTNATIAALFLRDKIIANKGDVEKAISAYNYGHVKYKKNKTKKYSNSNKKVFVNQKYVDKVTRFMGGKNFEEVKWDVFMSYSTKLTLNP